MKTITIVLFLIVASCVAPSKKNGSVINSTTKTVKPKLVNTTKPKTSVEPKIITPPLPLGAVKGNYNGDLKPFYARITKVDTKKGITTISFENKKHSDVLIPKTYGGTLASIFLDGFDRDLLLVTAKLKDPNFNKYFLYVLRNNSWKPVMNGFSIHKSNKPENLQVIRANPEKPNELIRYYSVFDLDENSSEGYIWRLLEESILKENR